MPPLQKFREVGKFWSVSMKKCCHVITRVGASTRLFFALKTPWLSWTSHLLLSPKFSPSRLALAQQLSYSLFLPVVPTRLRRTLLQEFVP